VRGGALAYLSAVASEGGENHKGNEESAEQQVAQGTE
jgi:hypothetical protein